MVKLVIWDWNGTLIADTLACMAADNHVLKTFAGTPVGFKTYQETIIIPAIDFYSKHGCDKDELLKNPDLLGDVFHSYYETRASGCRTRQGTRDILNRLKTNSIDSIILSNHTLHGITKQLQRLKLSEYFTSILANNSQNTSMKSRNKLEKLRIYLEQTQITPKDAFIIGDSPEETEIGKTLGITSIAITGGYYSEERLKSANPDYLITKLSQLKNILI